MKDTEPTVEKVLEYLKSMQFQNQPIEFVWYEGKQYPADLFIFAVTNKLPSNKYYCAICGKLQPNDKAHYCK